MATKAQMQWNTGLTSTPTAPHAVQRPGECGNARCGSPATDCRAPAGMTRIQVTGSREPARLYCHGWCATYGTALAEVRALANAAAPTTSSSTHSTRSTA